MIPLNSWTSRSTNIELLRQCKTAIRQAAGNAEVVLYGSRSRNDADMDSDYDILVLVDGSVNMALKEEILSNVYPLELESGAVLTLVVYSRQQWDSPLYRAMPFHKNVEREGVIV